MIKKLIKFSNLLMICLKPVKDETLPPIFREDGVYLSITGSQPHKLDCNYGESWTKPYSYNMFRVISEDKVIMLGSPWCNFYARGETPPNIQIGYTDRDIWQYQDLHPGEELLVPKTIWPWSSDSEPPYSIQVVPTKFQREYSHSYEIPLYEYLELTDPSDPFLTAQEVGRLPKSKLMALACGDESFSEWTLTQQMHGPRYVTYIKNLDEVNQEHWKVISSRTVDAGLEVVVEEDACVGNVSSIMVNNDYNLYTKNGDNRKIYGILPTDECPHVFVTATEDKIDTDYQFAHKYCKDEWNSTLVLR